MEELLEIFNCGAWHVANEKQQSLIEKIKKLFAIAQRKVNNDGSSNEQEAAAAMARAQELLAKYNLDIRTIQDSKEEKSTEAAVGKRERTQVNRSAMYKWQRELWKTIAEANFCFHWIVETVEERWNRNCKVKRHVILGSEANVVAVQMMGEYLTDTIERLIPYTGKERLSKSAISWREGCSDRLIERIQEKAERMQKEGVTVENTTCTAIAVRDAVKAEYAANYDARYGEGAYARNLAWEANWEANRAQREQKALERQRQEELELAKETPAQRAKREAKERKEHEKWERRWRREEWREATRLDRDAYAAGHRKGNDINLNEQLKEKP